MKGSGPRPVSASANTGGGVDVGVLANVPVAAAVMRLSIAMSFRRSFLRSTRRR